MLSEVLSTSHYESVIISGTERVTMVTLTLSCIVSLPCSAEDRCMSCLLHPPLRAALLAGAHTHQPGAVTVAQCPGAPAQGRVDDLKATCCPAAAGPAEPLACGLDTPEAADDSCSYECGSAFNEFVAGLLTEEVPGVPQDPLAPRRGPLVTSPARNIAVENAPAVAPGPLARR